jgi:adenosylmethionine-8-amino-7-oxononanoate aminotransferase
MAESQAALLDHGVWLRPFGRLLYTMPPFTSTTDDVTAITTAMQAVVG